MNWATVATVILTAACTILAASGIITADESSNLTATGGTAATSLAAFVTAIIAVRTRRKGDDK